MRAKNNGALAAVLACVSVIACAETPLHGAVIYVNGATGDDANTGAGWTTAKLTVTGGLAAAASGDQVWVASDTYAERIALVDGVALYGGFAGNETDLAQRNWTANPTILDGGQNGSVVTAPTGATDTTRIDGFTIRNGAGGLGGGGIFCSCSSPTIANNTITENSAGSIPPYFGHGGGIYCDSSASPTITNNTITANTSARTGGAIHCGICSSPMIVGNTITGNTAQTGGAINSDSDSSPTIVNNLISGNTASMFGGAIYCDSGSPRIMNNRITGNTAFMGGAGGGGGIQCSGSATIANNTIAGNTASHGYGGGIWCAMSPTIANNAITGNTASTFGGGVYCSYGSPTITNNTITGNTVAGAYGGGVCCFSSSLTITNTIIAFNSSGVRLGGTPSLSDNCVYGNGTYNYSGITDPTGTNGNISADPLFLQNAAPGLDGVWGTTDDEGDLHLRPGSLCIDAGWNQAPGLPATDLDGNPRVFRATVDMGAFEFIPGDFDHDADVDLIDFLHFQACFNGPNRAYTEPGCADADLDNDNDVDLIDFLSFQACFNGPNRSAACG